LMRERTARAGATSRDSVTVLVIGGSFIIVWLLIIGGYALLTRKRLTDAAEALAASQRELARVKERRRAADELQALNESERRHAAQLEVANKELEAFSYSVSHDLRAPLRSIDGFSLALMEDYADKLDDQANSHLRRIRAATQRMAQLIDDLLKLARVSRSEMRKEAVDLSALADGILDECRKTQPNRQVECVVQNHMVGHGDQRLLHLVLENLLGNAWKFTSKTPQAKIEFAVTDLDGEEVYFVRDNGAGFDMAYSEKLFGAFQRLHAAADFPGIGVGLATVQRIVHRHGGRVSADGAEGKGATFSFTLEAKQGGNDERASNTVSGR
jgi:light-regulated signal transduction histidine kinase (bacteriophytochrome)